AAPGLLIFLIGASLGLLFLRDYMLGISINIGPTMLAIMLTLFGTFMMFTGIILDSMGRMIRQNR
ncbi:MAG: glycosyltransferase family 2 protein, partial [Methanobacteriaceae archaeon]|nr:glycosyltransferase family 2 protein [Methanobacteriaceae archaeon]